VAVYRDTPAVATAVESMADKTVRNRYKLEMKPTLMDSPRVKRASNCHFMGDDRRAASLPLMINHEIVDMSKPKTGIAEAMLFRPLLIQRDKPGLVPKRKIDVAVTSNWPQRMA
jgi:hypothetical protein